MTIQKLEYVKKTLNDLEARAQEGYGRTASAISEKAAQTRQEADKLIEEMREASEFIRKTVRRYQRIDAELAQAVGAAAQGGGEQ